MRIDCCRDGIECFETGVCHFVVPSGQFGVSTSFVLCFREDQPELMRQAKSLLDVGVLCKQYLRSCFLGTRPFVGRLEEQVPASGQQLLFGVSVFKPQGDIFPLFPAGIVQGIGFFIDGIPAMGNTHFLQSIISQFLYMKTVNYFGCTGKSLSGNLVHRSDHIKGDFFNLPAQCFRYLFQNSNNLFTFSTFDHSH